MMKGLKLDLNVGHNINIPVKNQLNIKDINQFTLKKSSRILWYCEFIKNTEQWNSNPMKQKIQLYNTLQRWIILIKLSNYLIFVTESSCITKAIQS